MSQSTDAEFEQIIHSDETHIAQLETDDADQLRAGLAPAHASEVGEMPVQREG
jgi:hypothetical protein